MKNAVFWDVMPYDSSQNRRFGGTHRLQHQGDACLGCQLLLTLFQAPILVTLMMKVIRSSETSVPTSAKRRHSSLNVADLSLYKARLFRK
jgi:hypothetical protein